MKRLLCTGSLGLVGSACVDLFTKEGWNVTGIDNNGRASYFGTKTKKGAMLLDIREEDSVNEMFRIAPFDVIIHTAGQPSHDYATDHALEDFDVNARGTLILLEATRKYSPNATFIYVSTDKVYGEKMMPSGLAKFDTAPLRYTPMWNEIEKTGFDESLGMDFAGDRSLFGCSKAAADMYVQCYAAKFGMMTACFRPGCITGKNHAGAEQHGFLAYMAKCLKEDIIYNIYGTGLQVRDQIHAKDIATAFLEYIKAPKSGAVYNIGGGPERSVSVLEAIKLFEAEVPEKKIFVEFKKEREGDRKWDVHDVSKFRRDYPAWDYTYSLNDIIKDLV